MAFILWLTPHRTVCAGEFEKIGFQAVLSAAALKVSSMSVRALMKRRWNDIRRHGPNEMGSTATIPALMRIVRYAARKVLEKLGIDARRIYEYEDAILFFLDGVRQNPSWYPCVVPGWDNSSRSGKRGYILHNSTPELFRQHLRAALKLVEDRDFDDRIVFVKSWNEWAEGNYLEPDQRFGRQYLDVLHEEIAVGRSACRRTSGGDVKVYDRAHRWSAYKPTVIPVPSLGGVTAKLAQACFQRSMQRPEKNNTQTR